MAQLVVRNLEQSVKNRLQRRARRHGRSMEEEVRDILRNAANEADHPATGLGTRIASHVRGTGLKFDIPELRRYPVKPISFDEEKPD
jgi:plasmid stability protein